MREGKFVCERRDWMGKTGKTVGRKAIEKG